MVYEDINGHAITVPCDDAGNNKKQTPQTDQQTFQQMPMVAGMEEFVMGPTPKAIIDNVIPSYLNGFIYSALVESFCSEQNARMTAMDSANRNGGELKQALQIQYNRVRQAKITQEITEIAAGARAQQR
jgi:F-type H+-transporting ATPase subunit gamma